MFRIRRKVKPVVQEPDRQQDPAVPRFVARQLLALLRATCHAVSAMEDVYKAMPTEGRTPYQHLVGLNLHPAFDEVMRLIDVSEMNGLVTLDEAASIRAGLQIENPLPPLEKETGIRTGRG
ncbi:MAG: hypothetical protein OEY86_07085 [Nitrospira sp.]|nr:hypothetical protein [Nitrospira sp.]